MRTLLLAAILACIHAIGFAQPVTYDIPAGLETSISQEDYHFLVDTSIAVVEERYRIDSVKGGTIRLAAGQDLRAFNLDNLILKCAAVKDRTAWPAIIRDHFHTIYASVDAQRKIDLSNYDAVRKYLSIRIYSDEAVGRHGGPGALVSRVDLEGTHTVLMLDLPGAFTAVQRKDYDHWKKGLDEVFRVAQDNVDSQQVEKITKMTDVGGDSIAVSILGSDDYAASYALDLARNSPDLVGDWGCAISLPNRSLVALCRISHDKPVDFIKFIQLTKDYLEQAFQQHPQRISDRFFWYYQGKFTPIRVETQGDGNINVVAPFELAELMSKKKP